MSRSSDFRLISEIYDRSNLRYCLHSIEPMGSGYLTPRESDIPYKNHIIRYIADTNDLESIYKLVSSGIYVYKPNANIAKIMVLIDNHKHPDALKILTRMVDRIKSA